jgi:hypothetical protein
MSSILEDIASVLPNKYSIMIADLSALGDELSITETNISVRRPYLEVGGANEVTNIKFYLRLSPVIGVYESMQSDLRSYYSIVESYINRRLVDKNIVDIGNYTMLPTRDPKGNFVVSMNFPVTYYV